MCYHLLSLKVLTVENKQCILLFHRLVLCLVLLSGGIPRLHLHWTMELTHSAQLEYSVTLLNLPNLLFWTVLWQVLCATSIQITIGFTCSFLFVDETFLHSEVRLAANTGKMD